MPTDPGMGGSLQTLVTQTIPPMMMFALPSKPRVRCLFLRASRTAGAPRGEMDEIRCHGCGLLPAHLCSCRVAPHPGSQLCGVYQVVLTVTWMHMFLLELCFYSWCAAEK